MSTGPTGPEISRRQDERRREHATRGGRTEADALRTLQNEIGAPRLRLVSMWLGLVAISTLVRMWIASDSWGGALAYSALWASFFVLIWGWLDSRRRRRIRHVAGVSELERGTVSSRLGGRITVRGAEHEVSWQTETAVALDVGDEVYAAPRIAPGERIVLVRIPRTRGLLRDVMGPRSEAVSAGSA